MTTATPTSRKWTCDGCAVSIGQMDGSKTDLPGTWAHADDGLYCLLCRRDRAANEAILSAPDSPVDVRAKLRRAALIEFEVRRTPDLADSKIARACRSSAPAVAKARERLNIPEPVAAERG